MAPLRPLGARILELNLAMASEAERDEAAERSERSPAGSDAGGGEDPAGGGGGGGGTSPLIGRAIRSGELSLANLRSPLRPDSPKEAAEKHMRSAPHRRTVGRLQTVEIFVADPPLPALRSAPMCCARRWCWRCVLTCGGGGRGRALHHELVKAVLVGSPEASPLAGAGHRPPFAAAEETLLIACPDGCGHTPGLRCWTCGYRRLL